MTTPRTATVPRTAQRGLATATLALILAGCAGEPAATRPTSVPPSTGAATSTPAPTTPAPTTAAPSETATPQTPGEPGEPRVLATGLDVPWDLAVLPDGGALVTLRQRAEVVLITPGAEPSVAARIDEARPDGEGGLLGLTLSPDFATDQAVYLYYTGSRDNRVVRYHYADGRLNSPEPILTGIPKSKNHNGGRIRFGPDGMLYITTGDNHAKPAHNAQNTRTLDGKILRVTPTGKVPGDNPFGNEVWSYGHRNVQGIGWDGQGRMYASEFGSGEFDELNLIEKGGNYGWPEAEGRSDNPDFIEPLLVWATDDASPSGIAVTPDGTVFLASLRGERLWRAQWDGDRMVDDVYFDGAGRLRAVEIVGDELWLLTNNTARGKPGRDDDQLIAIKAP